MAKTGSFSSETITIKYENHNQVLIEGLWNFLGSKYRVEDVPWGGGTLKAHQLILDVFLPPERLNGDFTTSNDLHCHLESLLEFLYRGTVVVKRERLDGLLQLAREMDFQMLVDAVVSSSNSERNRACKSGTKLPWEPIIHIVGSIGALRAKRKRRRATSRPWEPEIRIMALKTSSQKGKTIVGPKHLTFLRRLALAKRKRPPKRKCSDCNYESSNHGVLKSHQDVVHGEGKVFKCPECSFATSWKGVLKHHSVSSHVLKSKSLTCGTCKQLFKNRAGFVIHQTIHIQNVTKTKTPARQQIQVADPSSSFDCATCNWRSKTKAALVEHERTHTQERPYKCPHCERRFNQTSNRSKHVRSYHTQGAKRFVCNICNKGLKTQTLLLVHQQIHAPDQRFQCPQCGKDFNQLSGLKAHVIRVHNRDPAAAGRFVCDTCGKGFRTRLEMVEHERTHTQERPLKCPHCEKGFNQRSNRSKHIAQVHGPGLEASIFVCETCGRRSKTRAALVEHERTHTQERPYKCPDCDKRFNQRSNRSKHVARLHGSGDASHNFVCDACGKRTRTRAEMVSHQRTHSQERRYKCPHCEKGFNQRSNMSAHVASVHGLGTTAGNFVCDACGKVSKTRASMVQHQRTHTQERPYKCPHCDKRFNQSSNRSKHVRSAHTQGPGEFACGTCDKHFKTRSEMVGHQRTHTQERPYKCPHCEKSFNQPSNRSQHVARIHGRGGLEGSFICETCGKRFNSRAGLLEHQRTHSAEHSESTNKPFKCPQCPYATITKQRYNAHMDVVHGVGPSRFTCEVCNKRFCSRAVLARHNLIHTKEKPFKCEHCPYASNQKATLKQHVDTLHGAGRFRCETCGKSVQSASLLVAHMRSHTQEKPFECPHCDHRTNWKENLARHIDVVHGMGAGGKCTCETCGVCLNSARQLTRHRRTHHRERPAVLPEFEREVVPQDGEALDGRVLPAHGLDLGQLACDICGERCSTVNELANHRRIHSSDYPFELFRFHSMQHL